MSWDSSAEMQLAVLNLLQLWRYQWELVNSDPKDHHKIPRPELVLRPWESVVIPGRQGPPKFATKDEIRAFFGKAVTYTPAQPGPESAN
jgi:hypothetical protein